MRAILPSIQYITSISTTTVIYPQHKCVQVVQTHTHTEIRHQTYPTNSILALASLATVGSHQTLDTTRTHHVYSIFLVLNTNYLPSLSPKCQEDQKTIYTHGTTTRNIASRVKVMKFFAEHLWIIFNDGQQKFSHPRLTLSNPEDSKLRFSYLIAKQRSQQESNQQYYKSSIHYITCTPYSVNFS